jgi:hypothetical protein
MTLCRLQSHFKRIHGFTYKTHVYTHSIHKGSQWALYNCSGVVARIKKGPMYLCENEDDIISSFALGMASP